MSSTLKLDWCSYQAARWAVTHWHYSKSLPPPPLVRIGVWEGGRYIGAVVFGRGASDALLRPYGLAMSQGAELVRVALDSHEAPVSRIVAIALRMLRRANPGLRLIVSFADPFQGHAGGIYQAGGWLYLGQTAPDKAFRDSAGKIWHGRMVSPKGRKIVFGRLRDVVRPQDCVPISKPGKHRYAMPLDDEMRNQLRSLEKPYPKRVDGVSSTAASQAEGGGATPTSALQTLDP